VFVTIDLPEGDELSASKTPWNAPLAGDGPTPLLHPRPAARSSPELDFGTRTLAGGPPNGRARAGAGAATADAKATDAKAAEAKAATEAPTRPQSASGVSSETFSVHTRPTMNIWGSNPPTVGDGPDEATVEAGARGRLLVYRHDSTEGAPVPLQVSPFGIGRREGHLRLGDDPYLSPLHARLVLEGGRWYMVDLGSLNGVYRRLAPSVELGDGDLILLGQQVLRFELVMEAERALRPAYQHGVALFGSPPGARYARLCQRTVEGVVRDVVHMGRDELTLGREGTDLAFPDDAFLSRRHAVLRRDASTGRFTLNDLGSSNGTFVALRGRVPVRPGDVFRLGVHLLRAEVPEPPGPGAGGSPAAAAGKGPGGRGEPA
jgi:pSer/pThr/pTyr-binding forkhead associated (FHA) protein